MMRSKLRSSDQLVSKRKLSAYWARLLAAVREYEPALMLHYLPLQVQSYTEYFQDSCKDPIHWLGAYNYFPGFTEGWTTYTEYQLLPQDTNLYSDTSNKEVLLQKYGMIYYQVIMCKRNKGL